jgi:lipopolysaccharide/colanic/teichoic acid biosynthesis glycosyltransferase
MAFIAILIFLPILILPIALLIKLTSKGPVLFKQKRIGQNKNTFYLFKFRTMRIDTPKDVPTHQLKNPEQWITPFGKFLRRTSLDEVPQLFNVLRGEMSIIGPRPALWNQDDLIAERDKYGVNDLRPGVSGWAQINGRDTLPIPAKAKLDGEYFKRQSFWFDLYIIFRTALKIFKDDTIVEGGTGNLGNEKKILIISQYFYPENFRINDLTNSLKSKGYDVTVLTGLPNYPNGKFFKGYNWFNTKSDKLYQGIKIIRLPIIPRGKNKLMLALNFLSFWLLGLIFSFFNKIKFDVVFTYGLSPILQGAIGNQIAKKQKIKSILYLLDFWPHSITAVDGIKKGFIFNFIEKISKNIYLNSTKILVSSPAFIDPLVNYGIIKQKITYWPQYYEEFYEPKIIEQSKAPEIPLDGKVNFTFTGNLGKAQGLEYFIDFLFLFRKEIFDLNIRFNFIGEGRGKFDLINKINDLKLGELVNFISSKSSNLIPYYLGNSDFTFLIIKNDVFLNKTIPAKFQTYLACGKPIFCISQGYISNLINENNLGIATNSYNFETILDKLRAIINREKPNFNSTIEYAKDNFSKDKLIQSLEKMLF